MDSFTRNRNPPLDEVSNKKHVADDLEKINNLRLIQTLQNYLKIFGLETLLLFLPNMIENKLLI